MESDEEVNSGSAGQIVAKIGWKGAGKMGGR